MGISTLPKAIFRVQSSKRIRCPGHLPGAPQAHDLRLCPIDCAYKHSSRLPVLRLGSHTVILYSFIPKASRSVRCSSICLYCFVSGYGVKACSLKYSTQSPLCLNSTVNRPPPGQKQVIPRKMAISSAFNHSHRDVRNCRVQLALNFCG